MFRPELGGRPIGLFHFVLIGIHPDTVLKFNSSNHLGQAVESSESSPSCLRAQAQLVDHGEDALARHTTASLGRSQSNCRKRRLHWIGRPDVSPILCWEVIEGQ